MRRWQSAIVVLVLTVVAAACGEDDPAESVPDLVLTVPQAHEAEGSVRVQGFLWTDGNSTRLCDAVLESYPPQCGAGALPVEDANIASIAGVESEGEVRWAESIRLAGEIVDDVFVVRTVELNASDGSLAFRIEAPPLLSPGPVQWVLHLTNTAAEPVTIRFSSAQTADVALRSNEGEEVYRWSEDRTFAETLIDWKLAAGETRRFALDEDELTLETGRYQLTAELTGQPNPGPITSFVEMG